MRLLVVQEQHGGYGVTVNTRVCGTRNLGSIPSSRPNQPAETRMCFGLTRNIMCIYLWYMKTQVNLKIDATIKENAQRRARELGLSLSSVVNATLSQFARTGELELSSAPRMTPYLERLVKEAREDYEAGKLEVYDNVDDLMSSLNKR